MAARKLELEFFEKMGVYTRVTRAEALASSKGKIIQGRWIDVNKGSSEISDYRSRYVGKELNRGQAATLDLYAATPPLEALKLLVSTCATEQVCQMHLMLSDVKGAYFHTHRALVSCMSSCQMRTHARRRAWWVSSTSASTARDTARETQQQTGRGA